MTDYRSVIKIRLAEIEREIANLHDEQKRLATASQVIDDLTGDGDKSTTEPVERGTISDSILNYLTISKYPKTPSEIRDHLSSLGFELESRGYLYTALQRLKKRGAYKDGKGWVTNKRA